MIPQLLAKYYLYAEKRKTYYKAHPWINNVVSIISILFWVFAFKSSILDANNIPSGSMQPTLKIGDFLFVNKMRYNFRIPFTDVQVVRYDKPSRGDIVTFTPEPGSPLHGKTLVKRVVGMPGDTVEVIDDEVFINGTGYTTYLAKDISIDELNLDAHGQEYMDLFWEEIAEKDQQRQPVKHLIIKKKLDCRVNRNSSGNINQFDQLSCAYNKEMRSPRHSWVIPADKYMVMGDNRDNSDDSRGCNLIADAVQWTSCRNGELNESSKEWGLIPLQYIEGKVYLAYFSVNWGSAGLDPEINPLMNLVKLIQGKYPDASVRWSRIFERIY